MPELRIVFDGPPGPESGRFVEVENAQGASVNAGEWVERPNGWWELRIQQVTPVAGYQPQSDAKVALVNSFKEDEERLLRKIESLFTTLDSPMADQRMLHLARTHTQIAFMLLNRAVFQPQRIKLPEDEPVVDEALERKDVDLGRLVPQHGSGP